MKAKAYLGFIISTAVTAALSVVVAAVFSVYGFTAVNVLYLPFLGVGKGLRELSLTGSAGNVTAIIVYALLCLIPAVVAVAFFIRDKKITLSKITLVLLSGYCFAMEYFFINQNSVQFFITAMPDEAREKFLSVFNLGIALAFYGLLLLAACFKIVAGAKKKDEKLGGIVKILAAAVGCACCYALFGSGLTAFIAKCKVGGADAGIGAVALLLHGGLYALLYVAALTAYGGATRFRENLFAPSNTAILKRISCLCLWAFFGGIISCIILNVLNFALVSFIKEVSFELTASLSVAVISAGAALACKLLERAIVLHEENALTI